jgi:hypothetical protein
MTISPQKLCSAWRYEPILLEITVRAVVYSDYVKLCGKCGKRKPFEEFHRWRSGHQPWCKACRQSYDARYFQVNRQRIMARKRERWNELLRWYQDLKESAPCVDCGGFFHHAAMTWDHLPGHEKVTEVSNLRRSSRQAVLDEVAKCDLVCANCHAVRSYERRRGVAQPG